MPKPLEIFGRGERIRTSGPCLPKTVLYQAELLPDRAGIRRSRQGRRQPIGGWCRCGKGKRAVFWVTQQACRAEAEIAIVREDDMIMERHAITSQTILKPAGDANVLPAWASVSRWVSMDQQHVPSLRQCCAFHEGGDGYADAVSLTFQAHGADQLDTAVDEDSGEHLVRACARLQHFDEGGKPSRRTHLATVRGTGLVPPDIG